MKIITFYRREIELTNFRILVKSSLQANRTIDLLSSLPNSVQAVSSGYLES